MREAQLRGQHSAVVRKHDVVLGVCARRGCQVLVQQAIELRLRGWSQSKIHV